MRVDRRVGVYCACGWRSNRSPHEEPPKFGTCPKCGRDVQRNRLMDDKRDAIAKADLRRYRG